MVGEVNPDVIVSDADPRPVFGQVERVVAGIDLVIGGSSAIVACGAARLGLRVGFVGVVGDDLFGRLMRDELAGRGIDVSAVIVDPEQRTGAGVLLSAPDDRAILTFPGTIPALRADQVPPELVAGARHIHVSSYYLQDALRPGLADLFGAAHRAGATTSLDCNWDPADRWDGMEILAQVDVFLPNAEEARRITGRRDECEAAAALAAAAGPDTCIVVKRGAEGALARRGAVTASAPALPVEVVDTTGAGDSFDAGFLLGWLEGRDLGECLRLAVACGSLSTRAVGGTAAQPTAAEARGAA